MKDRPHRPYRDHEQAMPLEEVQGLLLPPSRTGNRGPLNVTIVQVGKGNGGGGDGGSDLLRLEPPSDLRPTPSPLSDTSATLQSDNNDTFSGGVDPRLLLGTGGDRNTWEGRYHVKEHRRAGKATFQGQVYNFLERPTGWKCFLYHFSVTREEGKPRILPQADSSQVKAIAVAIFHLSRPTTHRLALPLPRKDKFAMWKGTNLEKQRFISPFARYTQEASHHSDQYITFVHSTRNYSFI